VQRSRELGAYLLDRAGALMARHPDVIREVRGRGLVVGVELTNEGYGGVIIPECLKRGLTAAYTLNQQTVIRLEPPLVVTKDDIDEALRILEQGVVKAKEKLGDLAGTAPT
jgi:putrescine aminotransferase